MTPAHDEDSDQDFRPSPPPFQGGVGVRSHVIVARAAGDGSAAHHLNNPRQVRSPSVPLTGDRPMYVHPTCKVHPAVSLAFAAARSFGLVIACDGGRPAASLLPFRLVEAHGKMPRLEFHVARGNPLGQLAEKGGTWLVAVQGHDAYVSPDWYASPDQVPTWLYETVHLSGPVRVVAGDHAPAHLEQLSEHFESWLAPKPAWALHRVSQRRREMLMQAIVVVEMTVETIEGNFKLNQHKSDADHVAVATALAQQDDPSAQAIARRMVALKPHLVYGASLANDTNGEKSATRVAIVAEPAMAGS
jgi:transcriptional regulator